VAQTRKILLILRWFGELQMNEKITDLIYAARSLCEALRDRYEILDHDDELKEYVDDLESSLDEVADADAATIDDIVENLEVDNDE
jgi:hypothetical protein